MKKIIFGFLFFAFSRIDACCWCNDEVERPKSVVVVQNTEENNRRDLTIYDFTSRTGDSLKDVEIERLQQAVFYKVKFLREEPSIEQLERLKVLLNQSNIN